MNIRARFEEIWPVPSSVYWHTGGFYDSTSCTAQADMDADLMNARLDTFTRCQETTEPVMSLIQELVWALEAESYSDHKRDLIVSAKQIMEQKK